MSTETTANFNAMLKKYLPYDLLREEFIKRDYFMSKVNIKDGWKGGQMDIPFKAAKATDYKFGGLVAANKLGKARYDIGHVDAYKELWGAMVFNDHDLMRHGDMEQSFIKIIPDQIEDFIFGMKEVVSRSLLNGGHIAKITDVTNAATGVIGVSRPEFFDLDQYIEIVQAGAVILSGYVHQINMEEGVETITIHDARLDQANAAVDLSAAANGDKLTIEGDGSADAFTSLDDQLLPLSAGGSANIFGVNKLSSPFTQAYAKDGGGLLAGNAANMMAALFQTQNQIRRRGNGAMPTDAIMSFTHLATVMEALENGGVGAGAGRQYFAKDKSASIYGWTEIEVVGVGGTLKVVGVNEMEDDSIKILDWRGIDLHTNGLFERHKDINGNEYTVVRDDDDTNGTKTGFKYISDTRMFGELVVSKPSYQATIHNV